MSGPFEKQVFKFPVKRGVGLLLMWVICCALAVAFVFISFSVTYSGPGGAMVQVLAVLWAVFVCVWPIRYWVQRERPVSLNEAGISNYLFGRPLVFIPWTDVHTIKRVHRGMKHVGGVNDFYRVIGTRRQIVVSDMMENSTGLISTLLSYAEKHHIKIT